MNAEKDEQILPCPFCGSNNFDLGLWSMDVGEVKSVECSECLAGAPLNAWNNRKPIIRDEECHY